MCGERGREILGESRRRLGRKARREGAALLPNEGSALVELRMDVEDGELNCPFMPLILLTGDQNSKISLFFCLPGIFLSVIKSGPEEQKCKLLVHCLKMEIKERLE